MNMFKSTKLAALMGIGMLLSVTSGTVGPSLEYTNQEVEDLLAQLPGLSSVTSRRRLAGSRRRLAPEPCDYTTVTNTGEGHISTLCGNVLTKEVQLTLGKPYNRCPIHRTSPPHDAPIREWLPEAVVGWATKAWVMKNPKQSLAKKLKILRQTGWNGAALVALSKDDLKNKKLKDKEAILATIQGVVEARRSLDSNGFQDYHQTRNNAQGRNNQAAATVTPGAIRGTASAVTGERPKTPVMSVYAASVLPKPTSIPVASKKKAARGGSTLQWGTTWKSGYIESPQGLCKLSEDKKFAVLNGKPTEAFKLSDKKWYALDVRTRTWSIPLPVHV